MSQVPMISSWQGNLGLSAGDLKGDGTEEENGDPFVKNAECCRYQVKDEDKRWLLSLERGRAESVGKRQQGGRVPDIGMLAKFSQL